MGRPYKIRDGHAFVLDGHRMVGGERIVLEDDVAASHADKIDPIDEAAEAADRSKANKRAKRDQAAAAQAAGGEAGGTTSNPDA